MSTAPQHLVSQKYDRPNRMKLGIRGPHTIKGEKLPLPIILLQEHNITTYYFKNEKAQKPLHGTLQTKGNKIIGVGVSQP